MSHRMTSGRLAHLRRRARQVDEPAAAAHGAAKRAAQVDARAARVRREAPRAPLVARQVEARDGARGLRDLVGAHLREILALQQLRFRNRQRLVERDRAVLPLGFALAHQRLRDARGAGGRLFDRRALVGLRGVEGRHHRDELFEKAAPAPEQPEGFIEDSGVFMLLDEDRLQRGAKIFAVTHAGDFDRRDRVENVAPGPTGRPAARSARAKCRMFSASVPPDEGSAFKRSPCARWRGSAVRRGTAPPDRRP